jgi:hypothetical protein
MTFPFATFLLAFYSGLDHLSEEYTYHAGGLTAERVEI